MKYDVFISYSRQDKNFVDQLREQLELAGYNYWIDTSGIESGDAFKQNIVKAIKASRVVIYISSKASNQSPWTTKEINYALHNKKPIIPIRIDNAEYNEVLQFDLEMLDYVDCTRWSKYQEGFERLNRALLQYFPERVASADAAAKADKPNRLRKAIIIAACVLGATLCAGGAWMGVRAWQAAHAEAEQVELFVYEYDWKTMTATLNVVLWSPDLTEAVIPASVSYEGKDFAVTGIGERAFDASIYVTQVKLPESITYIGQMAFHNCKSLKRIVLPRSVTTIGREAFPEGCEVTYSNGDPVDVAQLREEKTEQIHHTIMLCEAQPGEKDTLFLSNPGRHLDMRIDTLGRFYIYNGTIHDLIYDVGEKYFNHIDYLPTKDGQCAMPVQEKHGYVVKWLRYSEKYKFEYGDGYYYMKLYVEKVKKDDQGQIVSADISYCTWNPEEGN